MIYCDQTDCPWNTDDECTHKKLIIGRDFVLKAPVCQHYMIWRLGKID